MRTLEQISKDIAEIEVQEAQIKQKKEKFYSELKELYAAVRKALGIDSEE